MPTRDKVIAKALAKDPAHRFASPNEFAAAAANVLGLAGQGSTSKLEAAGRQLVPAGVEKTVVRSSEHEFVVEIKGRSVPKRTIIRFAEEPYEVSDYRQGGEGGEPKPALLRLGVGKLYTGVSAGLLLATIVILVTAPEVRDKLSTAVAEIGIGQDKGGTNQDGAGSTDGGSTSKRPNTKPQLVRIDGDGYRALMPKSWKKGSDRDANGSSTGTRYKWVNPANEKIWVSIDSRPGSSRSNHQNVVAKAHRIGKGSVGRVPLSGDPGAVRLRFTKQGNRVSDYFFKLCGRDMEAQVSAPTTDFESWRPTFSSILGSLAC